jgi:predicted transcriptional regulator/DNA-binding XRE family transcriptional regulator
MERGVVNAIIELFVNRCENVNIVFMTSKTDSPQRFGAKVRALRRREALSQAELAQRLGISTSYLNLIENNRRSLPAPLLIRLAQMFEVELHTFASDDQGRLTTALFEALSDPLFENQDVLATEVRELAASSPNIARALLSLYRSYQQAKDSTEMLSARLFEGERQTGLDLSHVSSEEVSELIQERMNYFPELEEGAERLWHDAQLRADDLYPRLVRELKDRHGVKVRVARASGEDALLRHFDPSKRVLTLSELLPSRSRKMQLAYQLGLLAEAGTLDRLTESPALTTDEARSLARAALANYFAAAVLMPYEPFLQAAREQRYDLDVIGRRFGTGFEQVAHRLTTLRRPRAEGVPFHMIRIDVAGNISKRFSASGIPIARFSGACPRWNIFAAFSTPGMIRIQLSRMPDSSTYFCIARTVQGDGHGFHSQPRVHAVGLGCPADRARELVYSDGLDLENAGAAIPVGVTCRLCERADCEQRAFPSLRHPLKIDENVRGASLYTQDSRQAE